MPRAWRSMAARRADLVDAGVGALGQTAAQEIVGVGVGVGVVVSDEDGQDAVDHAEGLQLEGLGGWVGGWGG